MMMVTAVTEILQEDTQTFCGLLLIEGNPNEANSETISSMDRHNRCAVRVVRDLGRFYQSRWRQPRVQWQYDADHSHHAAWRAYDSDSAGGPRRPIWDSRVVVRNGDHAECESSSSAAFIWML
jgi:hypothetical protein